MENTLVRGVIDYLKTDLGIVVSPQVWEGVTGLPFFLRDRYDFYLLSLVGKRSLLMVAKKEAEQTPSTIRKHLSLIEDRWHGPSIYVHPSISSYDRKRLIQYKVPFVVPGYQLYLPDLGIDLRENFRQVRNPSKRFTPATQAVVLHMLLAQEELHTVSGLASRLGYTAMTVSRAFDEIETAGVGAISAQGRERLLRPGASKRDLWDDAQPYLFNPVKEKLWIETQSVSQAFSSYPAAGLTALARYSDLAAPLQPVIALSSKTWNTLQTRNGIQLAASPEPDTLEIEIWRYDPELFAQNGIVDQLSLYLSLQEMDDERVETARHHMMEQLPW